MRKRREEKSNYSAIYITGRTLRFPIDPSKPITELEYPEFYDVSLGNKCTTGRCPWCYASGSPSGVHYDDVVGKLLDVFEPMTPEQRPFQVAIGGQQEPLEHPEFEEVLKTFVGLDIVPNYTTNGVLVDDNVVELTKEYCGGVAITTHPHLNWSNAVDLYVQRGVRTNLHIMVSDLESIKRLIAIYNIYKEDVEYFVLLPYMNVGFAAKHPRSVEYEELAKWVDTVVEEGQLAFGANMFKFLQAHRNWDLSLYPPEIMSKYLVLDKPSLYNNSFEVVPVERSFMNGAKRELITAAS